MSQNNLSLTEIINKRKSVKEFDPNFKIPREELTEMIELATKAPSSINLQPWRFVVVDNEETKQKLDKLVRFNQRQLHSSSAIILILADLKHADYVSEIYEKNVELGYMDENSKDYFVETISNLISSADDSYFTSQGLMDANLASMQLMLIATDRGYDTNPIGGFEKEELLKALNIDTTRYVPAHLLAIGKGVKEPHDSSRLPIESVLAWNDESNGVIGK
ncbi:nitroreductase family protein [Mammaliicoccus stepanovicii]|uniref:Nitroreductase family protein n=1 Tax=Mammaliicoccus stepanovicii TaxID=643214 RepID=A0A240AE67_9STAP|nr:nitroreductase family protein [Mammaliicoccus stepanovicii]PNZ77744.1 nitroreductase family protein [Mammaliicoccus stepanovicii]GGI42819.1 putative NAD(P)H nitroreductase YdgI [Mammaliicoccus stepanovicii]SNV81645.1 nitroreductase family protein [Mammaliicoccus stepanovicii]